MGDRWSPGGPPPRRVGFGNGRGRGEAERPRCDLAAQFGVGALGATAGRIGLGICWFGAGRSVGGLG